MRFASSSLTIFTTCWPGLRAFETSAPVARSRTLETNSLTTPKFTSASRRASRISRVTFFTWSSVRLPLPRTPSRALLSLSPNVSNIYRSPNRASANSRASNGCRSSSFSPTEISLIGTPTSLAMARAMPPLAVPSSLVRMIPVSPATSLNIWACRRPFCPVVASTVISTSCGAPGSCRCTTLCTLSSSAIRLTLVCNLPAVSMSSTSVPSLLAACTASWATAAASAPRSRATTGVLVLSPHCCSCSIAAALNVSPAANILVPGKKRESLPMVVVLPVPFTPTIRITVGVCETSGSTGPSNMLTACSIMSSRNCAPLVIFFSNASCSSSATSFAVVGTPTSEEMRISSTLSQNSSSSTSLNSATAALSCPTNEARLRLRPCLSLPNHPPDSCRSAIVSGASSTALGSGRDSAGSDSSPPHTSSGAGFFLSACTSSAVGTSSAASSTDVWRSAARWSLPTSTSSVERSGPLATAGPLSCSSSVSRLKKLRHERAIGDFLLSLQTLRHNSGGPGGILNYPVEHIRRGHRSFLMGDQQILAVSPVRVYHREETGQVEIVERRLGLIQHAESTGISTRPTEKHAEQERQRE